MRERLAILFEDNPMAYYLFTARFSRYSRSKDDSNVACFDHIKHDGRMAADHCWTHRSKVMKALELQSGDKVEFEAQIKRYIRDVRYYGGEPGQLDYGLERIRNLKVIERANDE